MPPKAKYNKEILKWARTSAKVSMEKAAKTISKSCKAERIKEWELPEGKDAPSVNQLKKLARLYRRPVEVFSLPFIPKEFPALKDFRKQKDDLGTAVVFVMREIQEKQEWLRNFYLKGRGGKLPFVGKYTIKSDPSVVAEDIRKTLGVEAIKSDVKPLKYWIEKAEAKRIFIALTSNYHSRLKLDSDIFKGFVIADNFAPFIFINTDDWDHGQLFTLVHELVHIWIGVSGISSDVSVFSNRNELHPVERFCNEVSARVLMPENVLKEFLPSKGSIEYKHISKASRRIGASTRAIVLRMQELEMLNNEDYKSLLRNADDAWKDFLDKEARKPKSKGGPNYYIMQLRRNGNLFSGIVLENYNKGKIDGDFAGRLLNIKEANFEKFQKFVK